MGTRMDEAIKRYEEIQAKNLLGGGVKNNNYCIVLKRAVKK